MKAYIFLFILIIGTCVLCPWVISGAQEDELCVVQRHEMLFSHQMRVQVISDVSVKITNPVRGAPLEYMIPDGTYVSTGDVIARFNSAQKKYEEHLLQLELAVVEAQLQNRLKSIDNYELSLTEQLEALQDTLAILKARLQRLLAEPKSDDVEIAEEKLKVASLNLRLAESEYTRAQERFKNKMISRAELDAAEKSVLDSRVNYSYAQKELELTMAPIALPYDIATTRLEITNCELEIAKIHQESEEQKALSEISRTAAGQQRIRKLQDLKERQRDIENQVVKSPEEGYISHVRVSRNDLYLVMRMWGYWAFMELPDMKTLKFRGMLLESVRKHFAVGDRVLVRVTGMMDDVIPCKIASISTLSHDMSDKPNSRSNQDRKFGVKVFDVIVEMLSSDSRLRPGMTGEATIISSKPLAGPAVPLKYVRQEGGRNYLIENGKWIDAPGVACNGWYFLEDETWQDRMVGTRSNHRSQVIAERANDKEDDRMHATGELEPVRKTEVRVGDLGPGLWPKLVMLVPEETMVKKGDVVAVLDSKDREDFLARQETWMAELNSRLGEATQREIRTRRSGEHSIRIAENKLRIRELATEKLLQTERMPLSYYAALRTRDLAKNTLVDVERKVAREHAKSKPTLSPVEYKQLLRNLERAKLRLEKAELQLAMSKETVTDVQRSAAMLALEQEQSACAVVKRSVDFNNAGANLELERVKRRVKRHQNWIEKCKGYLVNHTILAPVDGLVCYNKIHTVSAVQKPSVGFEVGARFTLMSIPDLSEMEVRVEIPERYYPQVKVGMPVEVRVSSLSDTPLKGEVSQVDLLFSNKGKKDSQLGLYSSHEPLGEVVFKVRVRFQNDGLSLKPGLVSDVCFPFKR